MLQQLMRDYLEELARCGHMDSRKTRTCNMNLSSYYHVTTFRMVELNNISGKVVTSSYVRDRAGKLI